MSGDAAPAAAAPAASTKALITPLINAASQGKVVTVMQLLDLGADPNATNKRGLTALHKAAISNQAAAAVTLIERSCVVNRARALVELLVEMCTSVTTVFIPSILYLSHHTAEYATSL